MPFRLAFMGSPDFAVPALAALLEAGHTVACVYSQPPKPAGRGRQLRPTPVQAFAEARGLCVRTPQSLRRPDVAEAFAALDLDVAVVAAYGLILPLPILRAPRQGCLNLHGSLLPRWRGAAPIQRAIMAGDRETGVQVMRMEEGLDTGPVALTARLTIAPDDTAETLHDRMAGAAGPLIVEALERLEQGALRFTPQSEDGVTYAEKISPAEARIDWRRPASAVDRHIRGLSPFPGAWFELPLERGPLRIKALLSQVEQEGAAAGAPGETLDSGLLIACGEGAVRLKRVQREGRQPAESDVFLRGAPIPAGIRLR